jgi:hypothetical protein
MAAEPVTADQYPDLVTYALTCKAGENGAFLGHMTTEGLPCPSRECDGTVSVYRGPQHGLAFDVPENPFETAPVDLELSWCNHHGPARMRLLNQDGSEHTGL